MPDPLIINPYFLREEFNPRGGTLPSIWTTASGEFSTDTERYLEVKQPGELVYSGDSLDLLRLRVESTSANFAFVTRFFGREDMKFQIRGRRQDADNFIALEADFENDTIKIIQYDSSKIDPNQRIITLETVNHNLKFDGIRYYSIELWMLDETLYGYVNGAQIITATSESHLTEMGFSLYVPEVYLDDPPIFNAIVVHDVVEANAEQLGDDDSNLYVVFRETMTSQIENWRGTKWRNFIKARKHWHQNRHIGRRHQVWEEMGYPLSQPRSEDWID